jgi:hypothetical protein
MATRRYSIELGQNEYQVTEAVGAATVTNSMEFTVDLAVVTAASDRGKQAVVAALQDLTNYILRGNWPPA